MKKTIFQTGFVLLVVATYFIINGIPKLINEKSYYKLGLLICCTIGLLYLAYRLIQKTRSDEVNNHPS